MSLTSYRAALPRDWYAAEYTPAPRACQAPFCIFSVNAAGNVRVGDSGRE